MSINMTDLLKEYKNEYNYIEDNYFVYELPVVDDDMALNNYVEDIKNDNFKRLVNIFETLIGYKITEDIEKIALEFACQNLNLRERILK